MQTKPKIQTYDNASKLLAMLWAFYNQAKMRICEV